MVTASELRKNNPISHEKQQPCFACGKHKTITQLHHVVSLKQCALWMNMLNIEAVETPMVWLCPNCHAYLHKWVAKADIEGLCETARVNGFDVYHRLCEVSHMGSEIESELARKADAVLVSMGGVR